MMAFRDNRHRGCVEKDRALEDVFEKPRLARSIGIKLDAQRSPIRGQISPEEAEQDARRGTRDIAIPDVRPASAKT